MTPLEPKQIAEQALAIAKNQGDSELGHVAQLLAELAFGLDVFFQVLRERAEKELGE